MADEPELIITGANQDSPLFEGTVKGFAEGVATLPMSLLADSIFQARRDITELREALRDDEMRLGRMMREADLTIIRATNCTAFLQQQTKVVLKASEK